jgi:hypothetical protein
MVLNKEGTWQMFPNFQPLKRVNDKLPIPFSDDLLDERNGAQLFNKLDLCLNYYQIHMKEEDIPKIVFLTNEGHYEFLLIPFEFCSAPSTFQSLMKNIFQSFIHHFLIFFFYDILIYNKTWHTHVTHVDQVLQLLVNHQSFLKRSNCAFGDS